MFTISRPIGGISFNGDEYLLDDNGTPKVFATTELAVLFMQVNGHGDRTAAEIEGLFNIKPVQVHAQND